MSDEHSPWVDTEIAKLEQKGCIVPWETVADVSTHPRPHMVLPLGVEPKKPRLFWDGRWLNLMCRHVPFKMDGVGNVARCSWQGAHQVTLDHKSGFIMSRSIRVHGNSLVFVGEVSITCGRFCVSAGARRPTYTIPFQSQ